MNIYRVGGCVRDDYMGRKGGKDEDRAVEVETRNPAHAFDELRVMLLDEGYQIWEERPEHLTIRAHYPKDHPHHGRMTADFSVCRKDGTYSDGRRPDFVEVGSIYEDLSRRDFSMNAIAILESNDDSNGLVLDPFFGRLAIEARVIQFVGNPMDRLREDGLRILRALRFSVTLGFTLDHDQFSILHDPETATLLGGVSSERIVTELHKMFLHDTMRSLDVIRSLPVDLTNAIFRDNTVKLLPTLGRKVAQ